MKLKGSALGSGGLRVIKISDQISVTIYSRTHPPTLSAKVH